MAIEMPDICSSLVSKKGFKETWNTNLFLVGEADLWIAEEALARLELLVGIAGEGGEPALRRDRVRKQLSREGLSYFSQKQVVEKKVWTNLPWISHIAWI